VRPLHGDQVGQGILVVVPDADLDPGLLLERGDQAVSSLLVLSAVEGDRLPLAAALGRSARVGARSRACRAAAGQQPAGQQPAGQQPAGQQPAGGGRGAPAPRKVASGRRDLRFLLGSCLIISLP
jgi:hypothetical protein